MAHKKPRRCTCWGAGACYESNGLLIERLQLNIVLMVNLTPHHFAWSRNMISKDSKYFNFISLTFVGPACTLRRLVRALLSNGKHPIRHIGSGRYSCNRSLGVWAQWFFILCPPNVLTGPLFLNRGVPGTPQAKRQNPGENT